MSIQYQLVANLYDGGLCLNSFLHILSPYPLFYTLLFSKLFVVTRDLLTHQLQMLPGPFMTFKISVLPYLTAF